MKAYGVNELRRMYLDFFESKDHLKMKSFSLVPHNDNSFFHFGQDTIVKRLKYCNFIFQKMCYNIGSVIKFKGKFLYRRRYYGRRL